MNSSTALTPARLSNLRKWNIALSALHLAQAAAMLVLTSDFSISVLKAFIDGPPGTDGLNTAPLFSVRIGWAIALFLGLAGIDHLITATIARDTYERDLNRGMNRFRWIEYSVSATIMVLIIAMYWGVVTINGLLAIAGANIGMILFGWLQEQMNPADRTTTTMLPFWFGTLVGVTPWLAMGVNLFFLSDEAPKALFAILIVQGIFFFCFGLNQWLQFRKVGKWADYAHGEKVYLVLSLGAKSLLAWQVFAVSLVA